MASEETSADPVASTCTHFKQVKWSSLKDKFSSKDAKVRLFWGPTLCIGLTLLPMILERTCEVQLHL